MRRLPEFDLIESLPDILTVSQDRFVLGRRPCVHLHALPLGHGVDPLRHRALARGRGDLRLASSQAAQGGPREEGKARAALAGLCVLRDVARRPSG